MAPKQAKALELGCVPIAQGKKLRFSPGQYATVFQAEVYAIETCVVENVERLFANSMKETRTRLSQEYTATGQSQRRGRNVIAV
jgi:hypothetical protein